MTSVDDLINFCFYNYADLAVKSASKYYKTYLYTDKKGKQLFEHYGIKFTDVIVLDEIEKYQGNLICMPKIFAMMAQNEPYIHLDFDTYTTGRHNLNTSVGFAYPEIDLKSPSVSSETIEYANSQYVQVYNEFFKGRFEEKFEITWDWSVVPNFSTFIVNKPSIVKMIYSKILSETENYLYSKDTPSRLATFVEQFLFGKYLEYYNIDHSFCYKIRPITITKNEVYINGNKIFLDKPEEIIEFLQASNYSHFSGYKKCPPFSTVVDMLREKESTSIL